MKIDVIRDNQIGVFSALNSQHFSSRSNKKQKRSSCHQKVKSVAFVIILFFTAALCSGQEPPKIQPPSPNAASLGIYGQIPVSLFNGLPQISIPIGNIAVGETDIDISLSYHGGGVRPDDHPGWVGLGWNLNAGGSITRIVKGGVDEVVTPNGTSPNQYSYYNNFGYLNNPNWTSDSSVSGFFNTNTPTAIPDPDEFMFNFGSYSGSFFLNQKGKWQVKSEQPLHFEVKEELTENFSLAPQQGNTPIILKRIYYRFTITTPDGNKYIFGGTPESIEFTRAASVLDINNTPVIAKSWFLTKIITNKNRVADFLYERGNIQVPMSAGMSVYSAKVGSWAGNRGGGPTASVAVINPVYLTEIRTVNDNVKFTRSVSNELPYVYTTYNGAINELMSLSYYKDLSQLDRYQNILENINWQKLDAISFSTAALKPLKTFKFTYSDNISSRLMLNSMKEYGADGISKPSFNFSYNTSHALPAYASRQVDHWGFYNGRDWFGEQPRYDSSEDTWKYIYTKENIPAYTSSKNSELAKMAAGSLISIQYPTGGRTFFDFEAHDYTKIVNRYPFTIDSVQYTQCGGLRIHKMWDVDQFGNKFNVKEYKYVSKYKDGGNNSSGILAGRPVYLEEAKAYFYNPNVPGSTPAPFDYWYWRDSPVQPLSFTNGNHVTYSEVVEVLADGSFTVYNYSNHDKEQYRDRSAFNIYGPGVPGVVQMDPSISLALDRGKLLQKRIYNSGRFIQQDTKYDYDETLGRGIDSAVRAVDFRSRIFDLGQKIIDNRAAAYVTYTFPRLIKRETTLNYNSQGLNPLQVVKSNAYDPFTLNLTQDTLVRSNSQLLTSRYLYPGDMLTNDPTGIYHAMVRANMRSPVIEKSVYGNGSLISNEKTSYFSPFNGIFVPQTFERSPQYTKFYYNNYDGNGNLLSFSEQGLKTTNFIWSYNNSYPIAEIVNIDYPAIKTSLGDAALAGWGYSPNPSKADIDIFLAKLKGDYPHAFITSFSYELGSGLSSKTDPKGQITFYEYDGLQRLLNIKDQSGNIIKNFRYHYAGLPDGGESTNPGNVGDPVDPGDGDDGDTGNPGDSPGGTPKFSSAAMSRSFKRVCGVNETGSTVVYSVPAGRYTASTQQAADALATADLNNNGQNYANQVGTCVANPVCEGAQYKLVNGICEVGIKHIKSSVWKPQTEYYVCTFYYSWSDGSVSADDTEINSDPCLTN